MPEPLAESVKEDRSQRQNDQWHHRHQDKTNADWTHRIRPASGNCSAVSCCFHKLNETRVRITSNVQALCDNLVMIKGPPHHTARWKRCVPRSLRALNRLLPDAFHNLLINLSPLAQT